MGHVKGRTLGRTFGVELECVGIGRGRASRILADAGFCARSEDYGASNSCTTWECKSDGSVAGPGGSFELATPILTWGNTNDYERLANAVAALRESGAGVNRTGGLHVHVGVEDLDGWQRIGAARVYGAAQSAIDSVLADNRRDNGYCSPVYPFDSPNWRETERAVALDGNPRYFLGRGAVNLTAYDVHSTTEYRQHNGTMSAREILSWVGLVVGITAYGAHVGASGTGAEYRALKYRDPEITSPWGYVDAMGYLDDHAAAFRYAY